MRYILLGFTGETIFMLAGGVPVYSQMVSAIQPIEHFVDKRMIPFYKIYSQIVKKQVNIQPIEHLVHNSMIQSSKNL